MDKDNPDGLEDVTINISVDKINFWELQKLLSDTNTGDLVSFHTISYSDHLADLDTPLLHKYMRRTYR